MAFDTNGIIVIVTLFVIFGVFFGWDFFREGTYYGFLAYIVAVVPVSALWFYGLDILTVYIVIFGIWDVLLLRDLLLVYRKNKEYVELNNVLLNMSKLSAFEVKKVIDPFLSLTKPNLTSLSTHLIAISLVSSFVISSFVIVIKF